jgi:hypothetical protein
MTLWHDIVRNNKDFHINWKEDRFFLSGVEIQLGSEGLLPELQHDPYEILCSLYEDFYYSSGKYNSLYKNKPLSKRTTEELIPINNKKDSAKRFELFMFLGKKSNIFNWEFGYYKKLITESGLTFVVFKNKLKEF